METDKLSQIIKSNNGQVLDLNTDCITCRFENDVFPFKMNEPTLIFLLTG